MTTVMTMNGEQKVIFDSSDVYVIVTPKGEQLHVTPLLALTVQYALLSGRDIEQGSRLELLEWLDEKAIKPFIGWANDPTLVLEVPS
jgi:hypothetical protein